jgi:hypothetical protein
MEFGKPETGELETGHNPAGVASCKGALRKLHYKQSIFFSNVLALMG